MYPCCECSKSFSTMKTLARHGSEIHTPPKHFCGSCRKTFRRADALKIHAAEGNCAQMDRVDYERARQELPRGEEWVAPQAEESIEWKQIGGGHLQKSDPVEVKSNEDDESEAESSSGDGRRSPDVFDADDSYSESSVNTSSEDSDDCESSSDISSGGEDSDEDEKAIPTEEGACDGSVETVHEVDDENEGSQQLQSKYINFARWRNSTHGIYSVWSSRSKKPYVVRHREWLKKIIEARDKLRKPLIIDASDSQLEAFREIAANVLRGYAVMSLHMYNIVRKDKHLIRILASEDSSYDQLRRALLVAREFLVPMLALFATPTCVKSEKAAFGKLPDE